MNMTELLAQLGEKNVSLSVKGDDLVVSGEEQVLEAHGLIEQLRKNKKALVEHIKAGRYVDPKGIVQIPPNRIPPACEAITPEMLPLAPLTQPEIDSVVSRVPGGAPNVQDIYPLAPLQEGMLFHHLIAKEGDVYLNLSLLTFDTRARLDRFLQAIHAVIDRHDTLRTAVLWEGLPEPVQVVWRRAPLVVEEISLDPTTVDVAEELSARFDPRRYRLDVRQAPMIRVYIAHDAREDRWVMLLLFHHLQGDHTMYEVLLKEIQAHLLGRAAQLLPPPPLRNFIAQARLGISQQEHEAFFRQMLEDVDEPTAPYGLIDAQSDGSGIRVGQRKVDAELAVRLRQRARGLGVRAASLCHVAWAQVLSLLSGQEDVVFGTVMLGRMQGIEGARRALGMLINTLPIRIRVGAASVEESVRQTHQLLTELVRHEHASLALAQRCSAIEAPAPLFSAILNYRYTPAADTAAGVAEDALNPWEGIEFREWRDRNNYPLSFHVDDLGEGFALVAKAQSPIDPDRVCTYMHTVLGHLVEALEQAPTIPARNLNALPDSERHQLLVEWNRTEAEYPRDRCIHELFREQAERTPERIALISERDQVSYRELNRRANQLGRHLRGLGVGPEVLVGLCLERTVETVLALLGVLKAGGAYLPLDPESPVERLGYMLEDAGAGVVLTEQRLEGRLPSFWGQTVSMDVDWEWIGWESDDEPENDVVAGNPVYCIYTSGSTGKPKGVMVEHRNLVNYTHHLCQRLGVAEEDESGLQFATVSTITADLGNTCIYPSLVSGGRLHILSYEVATDGVRFEEYAKRNPIDVLKIVPSHLSALLGSQLDGARMLPGRYLILGGEALSYELVNRIRERGAGCEVINHYGPTETTIGSLTARVSEGQDEWSRAVTSPIGRPIANTEVYVLNREFEPVPVGVRGELYIAGEGVARGYWGRPELTAERFIPNRLGRKDGGRLYRTGDVVRYLSDGKIEFIGRRDDQVKVRGYRVELGEIEAVLNEHRSVRQSVVVADENERGEKRLLGYVVGEEEAPPAELKRYVRERLPEYMVPEAILMLEEIPLTANGKIDRKRLSSVKDAGRQPELGYGAGTPSGARTPVEEILVGIFEEVLKVERIGIHDDFFEIGGHSLLATQVISRVRAVFGVEIGVDSIFDDATAEGLARRIEEAIRAGEKDEAPPLIRVSREDRRGMRLPLSFAQQRLWFSDQLDPGNPAYNIPGAVALDGRLDLEVLERVINEIVRRHEVLRTRFEVEANEPVQVIDEWEPQKLEVEDLTGLTEEEREEEASRMAGAEARTGFDLSRGPLLRVKVLKLQEERHVALYTMHHIVSDAWSTGILAGEVGALYHAYSMGEESPLDELPIQYADFAVWQRSWLQGEVLENQLAYWRSQLGGDLPVLELPTDRPRPAMPTHRGAQRSLALPTTLSDSLKDLSLKQNCTMFMTLLAAFKILLSYLTGETDICVGADIANRNRAETEKLIGFFINQIVLRSKLAPAITFEELLRQVRENTLQAYAHQDLPFEKLVEALNPGRDEGITPLFQVKMVLQNAPTGELSLPAVTLSPITAVTNVAKFDLALFLTDTGSGLSALLQYNTDLFEERTPIRMLNRFHTLLNLIVQRPDSELQELIAALVEGDRREEFENARELTGLRQMKLKNTRRRAIGGARVENK